MGECTLIGASGEYSDFQHIMGILEDDNQYDVNMDDGFERSPSEIYNLLRTIMYNRRYVLVLSHMIHSMSSVSSD